MPLGSSFSYVGVAAGDCHPAQDHRVEDEEHLEQGGAFKKTAVEVFGEEVEAEIHLVVIDKIEVQVHCFVLSQNFLV